ncbi:hypothetical protein DOTSEDRAFT_25233 [Dothistroma septosporum NZE10]|uniref:FAD linked oxidase N-terminal domain-containing protein n=1 Tax=Dothistroma septosporum (strain NZE10 / CBS 128990) TaxID=675120 RepID=M2Y4Q7_DOTSN|nr:hypothetical protein DOTSEDRAFT_25233 [Dothistroma septosporum NZE10]
MAPHFANRSCDRFTATSSKCVIGTYVSYAVAVRYADDVTEALAIAERHNVRVFIRNTGHDYNGKSTGAGSLGIWTHRLKDVRILQYRSAHYNGKAMQMGAGVQGLEAYAAA